VIAGDKSRSDDVSTYTGRMKKLVGDKPRRSSSITRLDRELIWGIDDDRKQYTEMTFAQMREMAAQGLAVAGAPPQPEARPEIEMEYTAEVQRTGRKETVNGFAAEQVIVTLKGRPKDPKSEMQMTTTLTLEQWLSTAVPGGDEVRDHQRLMAEKLGMDPELRRMGGAVMGSYGEAFKEMAAKLKDLKGYPVRVILTIESGGPQLTPEQQAEMAQAQAQAAQAEAEAKRKQEESDDAEAKKEGAAAMGRGDVGGALGGFLGKKLGKSAKKKADEKAAGMVGGPPGTGGPVLKSVTDVVSVTTGASGASFEVPAGYKKVEMRGRKK
jgi:hypothetical protein